MQMFAIRPSLRLSGRTAGLSRLDLRAPEDYFATDQQTAQRYYEPVNAPAVEKAIASFMDSWQAGDEAGATLAANEIKSQTSAYFQQRGVPTVAHPVLPPQFVREVADVVEALPFKERETHVRGVADRFGPDLRSIVGRELAPALADAVASWASDQGFALNDPRARSAPFKEQGGAVQLSADRDKGPSDSTNSMGLLCDANRADWVAAVEEFGKIAKKIPGLEDELAKLQLRFNQNRAEQQDLRKRLGPPLDPITSGAVVGSGVGAKVGDRTRRIRERIDWLQTQIDADAQRISELQRELHDLRESKKAVARRKAIIKRRHTGCRGTLEDPYEYMT